MKKLVFILLLLPMLGSAQNFRDRIKDPLVFDTVNTYYRGLPFQWQIPDLPPPVNVKIYIDDEDPVQTLIDALKKIGVIVERTEWNYEKKYSNYLIIKTRQ